MFDSDEEMVIVYLQHWYISLAYGEVIDFNPSSSVVMQDIWMNATRSGMRF